MANAPGFERNDSIGSASVGKVRQINYGENLSADKGGSSSYIIDDEQTPDMQNKGSFENNNFTNMTNIDRYSNDISMLKLNEPGQDLQVNKKGKKNKGRNQANKQSKSQPMQYDKENFIDEYDEDMRQYETPDMMIQKSGQGYTDQAKQIAHDIMDMELGGGPK